MTAAANALDGDPASVDRGLSAFWRQQYDYYRSLLCKDPRGRHAWYWRIKLRIYRFLISRYESGERRPYEFPIDSRMDIDTSVPSAEMGKQPKTAGEIRGFLQDIRRQIRAE